MVYMKALGCFLDGFYKNKSSRFLLISLSFFIGSCSNSISQKKYNAAIDYKKAALLNVELGKHYLAQGYTERAKKKFLHALDLMPNLPESHSGIGYFWEMVGEYKEAEKHYKRSISLGNGRGLFYNQYGLFLCERNRYKEANKNFILAANDKNYTKTADVYNNAGICALKYRDQQQAEQYFTKALNHDPKRVYLFLELANLNLEQRKFEVAEHHLNKFYNENNNNLTPSYLWLSIKLAKHLGKKDKIASQGLLLKNLFPNSQEYHLYQREYEQG